MKVAESHIVNDVCMGMSHGKPQGRGMGPEDTNAIFVEAEMKRDFGI